jgi:hypothetical protein
MSDRTSNPNAVAETHLNRRRDHGGRGDGAIVPPDPPVAPAITDAEAGGSHPTDWQRHAAPSPGPRTHPAPPRHSPVERTALALVWLAVVAGVVIVLLGSLLGAG